MHERNAHKFPLDLAGTILNIPFSVDNPIGLAKCGIVQMFAE